jgi:hypothetical protein
MGFQLKNFGATLPYYENEVSFLQRVEVKGTANKNERCGEVYGL